MPSAPHPFADASIAHFQRRWAHLQHPDVRNLAWLLEAPDMIDRSAVRWRGQVAHLPAPDHRCDAWLVQLDRDPQPLIEYLAAHAQTRLGQYAEKLLAWYFDWAGVLQAHSLQVRSQTKEQTTIGEFDFLLNGPDGLTHWEFACKFYLYVDQFSDQMCGKMRGANDPLADLVGPNLTDNLRDKSSKILNQQLALGRQPAALAHLPAPLYSAQMLIRGWLFYPPAMQVLLPGLDAGHCRGTWRRRQTLDQLDQQEQAAQHTRYVVLPRLRWLAPARLAHDAVVMTAPDLATTLQQRFITDDRPVLVAQLDQDAQGWLEVARLFVVPDHWPAAAPAAVA